MYERASRTAEAFTPSKTLIRGSATLRTRKVILTGAAFVAGSLLGQIVGGTAVVAAKAGGNTGNGTFVIDATTPVLARAKTGVYTLRCVAAAANGGTFRLDDPDGIVLGDIVIAGGAGGTATENEHIKGVLTDGATDFVVGDGFDITVTVVLGKAKLAAAASTDGSQVPSLVLAYDVDASAADVEAIAYESGDFVQSSLTFGAGLTADGTREQLRRLNITFG
jgi:hypothetical protein